MRKRERFRMVPIDEINMTPLLDLTFVLLIAFMITMPLMEYGTTVTPPQLNSEKLPDDNFKSIALTAKGTILIDNDTVPGDELIARLKQLKAEQPKLQLLLRADGKCPYKEVIALMATIRRGGFADVTLVTQSED